MTRPPEPRFEETAETISRLATLLAAGVAPGSAWRHLAAASDSAPVAVAVVARLSTGSDLDHDLPERILDAADAESGDRSAWAAVAAAWLVARDSGAPLAPSLLRLAGVLRSLAQARREVDLALAGPVATARIIMFLPAVGLVFALLLGISVGPILVGTPIGWGCLALGLGLLAIGVRANRRMIRSAGRHTTTAGLRTDLLVIALSGGGPPSDAAALVDRSLATAGIPVGDDAVEETLVFSAAAGVPVIPLLEAAAEHERRVELAGSLRRAAVLSTRLLVPLGLCFLPAFVVLGVVPTMLALVSSTSLGVT